MIGTLVGLIVGIVVGLLCGQVEALALFWMGAIGLAIGAVGALAALFWWEHWGMARSERKARERTALERKQAVEWPKR